MSASPVGRSSMVQTSVVHWDLHRYSNWVSWKSFVVRKVQYVLPFRPSIALPSGTYLQGENPLDGPDDAVFGAGLRMAGLLPVSAKQDAATANVPDNKQRRRFILHAPSRRPRNRSRAARSGRVSIWPSRNDRDSVTSAISFENLSSR